MPYVTMYQEKYHYAASMPAQGEPEQALLLVHGAGGTYKHWEHQLEILGRQYLVIAPDLPGHGQSAGRPLDSVSAYRSFIEDFSDNLLGMPFYLAGHSLGGAIAMDYARLNPGRLAGMILVGTGSRLKVRQDLLETYRENMLFEGLSTFLFAPEAQSGLLEAFEREMSSVSPAVYYNDFYACNNFNIEEKLNSISVPTLVVSSDLDVMTPIKYGERLAQGIPGALMKVISGAGHMMMLEQPDKLNEAILDFMVKKDE